jgi:hypothetical protein
MNEKRLAVVKHAFQFLDEAGTKRLQFDKLNSHYNSQAHPRVRTREKTAQNVYNDFVNTMGPRATGNTINEQAFIEYYADINACLP